MNTYDLLAELLTTQARAWQNKADDHEASVRLWESGVTEETPDPEMNARWRGRAEGFKEAAQRLDRIAELIRGRGTE